MKNNLFEITSQFFKKAGDTPEGQKILQEYDQTFQFELKEPFYLEIEQGRLLIEKGRTSKRGLDFIPVNTDEETLIEIFEAKLSPVEAIEKSRFSLAVCNYEGSLLTILVRIGQEIVKEEAIKKFSWG